MKKRQKITLLLCGLLILTGCASGSGEKTVATVAAPSASPSTPAADTEPEVFTNRDLDASYSEADGIAIRLNGNEISCDSPDVSVSGSTVIINEEGTYLLSGTLADGSVIVDAEKSDKIQLVLTGVNIHSETSAPIYVRQADKVFLTLAAGTENSLSNGGSFTADGSTNIDGVIFSKDDLTLNGTGKLTITSPGGHGIVCKDSLRLTGGTYTVEASGHGLSGKDEVSIADGVFDITAGKDGIHGENSDDAELGSVYLENGVYRITAAGDGISASGSCRIAEGDYTVTTGGGSGNAAQHTTQPGFGRGAPGDRPQFDAQTPPERGAGGKGDKGMNQQPANGRSTAAPGSETNTVSAKGIKAGSLTILGGTLTADCGDDALHSNLDLTIDGGTLTLASGDDGIHADGTVTIASGTIAITQSYEGIEGKHVLIQGGDITLQATDDGLNAAGGVDGSGFGRRSDTFTQSADTPGIVISGGSVSVTAYGDGIDANGTLEITGGTVTVTGPTYGDTSVLDFDITGTISGGTFVGTGAASMAQTFTDSTQGVISVRVGSQSAGTAITLTDSTGGVILTHTPALDYEIVILSCPALKSGESYTLTIGDDAQSFTAQ